MKTELLRKIININPQMMHFLDDLSTPLYLDLTYDECKMIQKQITELSSAIKHEAESVHDIYRYGLDAYGNAYILVKDYGIDSLYHAQRILEKTLGKVDGYQSDDGILEHKCAISAVKKLYEQKPAWKREDEQNLNIALNI